MMPARQLRDCGRIIAGLMVCGPTLADVRLPAILGNHMVVQRDRPAPVWGWADPGEMVVVKASWTAAGRTVTAGRDGRWRVDLPAAAAGGPHTLTISGRNEIKLEDVLVGEVWLCSGQSNMQMPLKHPTPGYTEPVLNHAEEISAANYPDLRLFLVPYSASDVPLDEGRGEWKRCSPESVPAFTALGYFFGRDLHRRLGVPVGLIGASQGASALESWTSREVLAAHAEYAPILERYQQALKDLPAALEKYAADLKAWEALTPAEQEARVRPWRPFGDYKFCAPATLYNGMIHPIIPFGLRGVIFYQGEENAIWTLDYRTLFARMMASWRLAWDDPGMYFFYAQLSSYDVNHLSPISRYWVQWHPNGATTATISDESWARVQEAQFKALAEPHTGMAVTVDIGDPSNIHPVNKQEVARRLALWAFAKSYGQAIVHTGPLYHSMRRQGNKAVIRFEALQSPLATRQAGTLPGFTIAGDDRVFHPAQARIEGDEVVVWSDDIAAPAAVRYAWGSAPDFGLFNQSGLPASPFRTDDWAP